VLADLLIGRTVSEGMKVNDEFLALRQSQGEGEPDEDVLVDAVAFAGVSKFPPGCCCQVRPAPSS
jgi:nitrogen fixation NifU-like protein